LSQNVFVDIADPMLFVHVQAVNLHDVQRIFDRLYSGDPPCSTSNPRLKRDGLDPTEGSSVVDLDAVFGEH
jgi:hypothetical protein